MTPFEQGIIFTVLASFRHEAWNRLGTPEEQDAAFRRFEEIATDVTSWEMPEEFNAGLIGPSLRDPTAAAS